MTYARKILAVAWAAAFGLATTVAFAQHEDPHEAPQAEPAKAADPHGGTPVPRAAGHADGHNAPAAHAAPAGHGDAPSHGAAAAHGNGDEHAASGEHGAAHGEGHHGPAPINWTDLSDKHRPAFIALLINFGLLATLYYTLGKKPIVEGLKQRRVNIGKDIEEARAMLDEAKERAKKYQGDLKNADTDAATAKGALVSAGKGEVDRLLSDTEERSARMKGDASRLVEQEMKQLQQDLLVETIDRSIVEAHKLLEQAATPEDHARLANELLAELARKPAGARMTTTTRGAS